MATDLLMVFDTASMYFRSFFGLPSSMRAPDGTPINAVRGLLDSIARLITQYHPTRLACAWDNDWRPGWRVELIPGYKAHRVAATPSAIQRQVVGAGGVGAGSGQAEIADAELAIQIPIIVNVLEALGVPVVGADGYEADDVAASLAAQCPPALVVTGDRDLFQLAHGDVRVIYIGKGVAKHDLVDSEWVRAKYGIDATDYVDFAVLRGDPSDGLPGVKGIGEKSAAQLVQTYGGVEQLLAAASDPASGMSAGLRTKLAAAVDYLGPATEVVRVVSDLACERSQTDLRPEDADALDELDRRFDLGGSLVRIRAALAAVRAG